LRSNGLASGDGSRPNEGSRSNGLTSGHGLKANDQVFFRLLLKSLFTCHVFITNDC
jgi:hypothetical protein